MLNPDNSGIQALNLMVNLKLKHLPVVRSGHYLCLLSEKDIAGMTDPNEPVGNLSSFAPCLQDNSSVLDALHLMSNESLTLLPITGESGEYTGFVTLQSLVDGLNELCNASAKGALIAIEVNRQDYVLSQIIHLMESNSAGILGFFTYSVEKTDLVILLFKIDMEDASPVLRSLERFNYKVIYYLQKQLLADEVLKKRLDELMFYLEM